MVLSKQQKIELAKVLNESTLDIMRKVATEMIINWSKCSAVKETEHQTVVATVKKEERTTALQLFLEELERIAHE
tara:strand:- start:2944 stop:3168 length:225 start_codon:yes stop_codon:yes gene_type:complete